MSENSKSSLLKKLEEQENLMSGKRALVDSPTLEIVWVNAVSGDFNITPVSDSDLEEYIDLKCDGDIIDGDRVNLGPHHSGYMIATAAQG